MNGNDNFFAILDRAGSSKDGSPSVTNDLLVQALDQLHPSHPARIFVQRAAESNSALGKRLARLETWGKSDGDIPLDAPEVSAQSAPPKLDGLPPGFRIGDVGTLAADQGAFDGQLNPVLMSGPNWGYYAKQNLGAQSGHIFDRQFTIGDPNTGVTFSQGMLAYWQDKAEPIVRDAQGNQVADLRQWG